VVELPERAPCPTSNNMFGFRKQSQANLTPAYSQTGDSNSATALKSLCRLACIGSTKKPVVNWHNEENRLMESKTVEMDPMQTYAVRRELTNVHLAWFPATKMTMPTAALPNCPVRSLRETTANWPKSATSKASRFSSSWTTHVP